MDPIAGATLVGQAAQAFLRRSRVVVNVNEDFDTFADIGVKAFFLPVESPDKLTPLPDSSDKWVYSKPYDWVVDNRGCELGHTVFEFTIQALNATVALVGGKPVVNRNLAITRGIAAMPPPAGGPLEGRFLSIALDEAAITCHDGDNPGAPPVPFRFSVPQGTTEIFRVHASASVPSMWHLKLLFIVNGRRIEYDLKRENGDSFVTLPYVYEGVRASYTWEQGQWVQVPNRVR